MAPRSGLASKHFIDVGAGVIDADYRGELKVLLFNFGEADFEVKEGERVAQLVVERVCIFQFILFIFVSWHRGKTVKEDLGREHSCNCQWLTGYSQIYTPDVVEVQELEESVRGAGGFGSTG